MGRNNGKQGKTECVNGHSYSGENLILTKLGHRTCRTCRDSYRKRNHLANRLSNIRARCRYPSSSSYKNYGGRGIKCFLTLKEINKLWERDKAYLLNKPSIDRIDINGDYTFDNCRFIENYENNKIKRHFKLNYVKADNMRKKFKQGITCEKIAEEFNVSKAHVYKVVKNLVWNFNQPLVRKPLNQALRESI